MRKVHLDFESRSRVNIWDTGAYVYASDESTEVVCLAYAIDNGPVKKIRFADIQLYALEDPFVELRELAIAGDTLFYAHSALFEQLIWKYCMMEKFGMPRLPISKCRCTAAKALSHGLPKSLKDAARAMGLSQQKDTRGSYLIQRLSKPQKDGSFCESAELMREFEDYCGQDVETERELDHMLPELNPLEQYVWFEDQLINQRGIAVDTETVDTCLSLIEEETAILKKEIFELTGGVLEGVSKRLAVLDYFAKKGHRLPDFTKATVENAVKSGILPPDLVKILRIRQQLGMTSVAKYSKLKEATCYDNRLKDILLYHSASTGRWGGKLVQMQNLPKGNIKDTDTAVAVLKTGDLSLVKMMYGNTMNLLSSCIRGMFVAPEGHDLIVSDYSAIEARVLMWFCGQNDVVRMFNDGIDMYIRMADLIGVLATRVLGKTAFLGCGYGMSYIKFQETCESYGIYVGDKTEEVFNYRSKYNPREPEYIKVSPLCVKAVDTYRKSFPKVPAMWYAQERAMKAAIQTKKPITCGMVTWDMDARGRDFLYCTLPSGRRLAFHKPSVEGGSVKYFTTDSYTRKYIKKDTYGGKIIENIIQAIARDILAHAMLRAELAKYPIVLTVHDELVAEVPEGFGSVEAFNDIITAVPEWAKKCPIDAEGWRGKRYKK